MRTGKYCFTKKALSKCVVLSADGIAVLSVERQSRDQEVVGSSLAKLMV